MNKIEKNIYIFNRKLIKSKYPNVCIEVKRKQSMAKNIVF